MKYVWKQHLQHQHCPHLNGRDMFGGKGEGGNLMPLRLMDRVGLRCLLFDFVCVRNFRWRVLRRKSIVLEYLLDGGLVRLYHV